MKKIITPKGIAAALLLSACSMANAQEQPKTFGKYPLTPNKNGVVRCASTENELILQENNPKRAREAQFEAWMEQKLKEKRTQKSGNNLIAIPVVVHVVFSGPDNVGQNENISYDQVQSQIDVLNEDFRKMAGTPGDDQTGNGVDTMIEFCLATVDPDGNTIDGIHRYSTTVNQYTDRTDIETLKTLTIWDPEKYLNIWTVNMGGELSNLLGYAQFPDYNFTGLQEQRTSNRLFYRWCCNKLQKFW